MQRHELPALAVAEAVRSLGYVQEAAAPALLRLLDECETEHPRSACARYRGAGEQLDRQEKRALGIRANAAMSRQAASELTTRGRSNPLRAHELTVLRAVFTRHRWRSVMSGLEVRDLPVAFRYRAISRCAGCDRLSAPGAIAVEHALLFPPPDCEHEACNLAVAFKVDFLAALSTGR